MKILLISMHSIHSIRWIENLKNSGHHLYWFDISNRGKIDTLETVNQISDWKKRKLPYIKGEYWLSKKMPNLYSSIRSFMEVTENEALEKVIKEIKPDVIHSFEMQAVTYPIVKAMNKYPEIKWIYSCWGNDLFYFQNIPYHKNRIKEVLKRVDYMHADCQRDYPIAFKLGFKGTTLEVIPTGGGFKINELEIYKLPNKDRKIILVKGYQNIFGRAINIIKALERLKGKITEYDVVIFGAHAIVQNYVAVNNLNYTVYGRHDLSHQQTMELIGKSFLYIGNNISDGMPNTLLEAIIMEAFPIQSNPGNASAEIIEHGVNGFLINDPEDVESISNLIVEAIEKEKMREEGCQLNKKIALEKLDYNVNQQKIVALYKKVEAGIGNNTF